jgi:hypothetical protein
MPVAPALTMSLRLNVPKDRLRRADVNGYPAVIAAKRAWPSISAVARSGAREASAAAAWVAGPVAHRAPARPTTGRDSPGERLFLNHDVRTHRQAAIRRERDERGHSTADVDLDR